MTTFPATTPVSPTLFGVWERVERESATSYLNIRFGDELLDILYEAEHGLDALDDELPESELTAEEHRFIREFNIADGPYESIYSLPGASDSQKRHNRAKYHRNGAARNRLLSAQNWYGGNVPEHLQEARLRDWSDDEIQGKGASALRAYMSLWLRPLMTSGNLVAVRAIMSAYRNAVEAERTLEKESLANLGMDFDGAAQQDAELEQFVLALSKRQRDAEQEFRPPVAPARVPPTAPLAPPSTH
ncbi:hypothetical protein [Deinococcus saxicola]|uniref:hypothetical protein n=1 Tax=Deinococcus saxicola TaxID=249406 RepID=UPI0039EE18B1